MGVIGPGMRGRGGGERGCCRPQLRREGKGVGLERADLAIGPQYFELVGAARADIGDEYLPHANVAPVAHHMTAPVPVIEVADHRNPPRIGRPDGEMNAAGAFMGDLMRAKPVIEPQMRTLGDQIVIQRSQHRAEAVGIGHPPLRAIALRLVFDRLRLTQKLAFEQPAVIGARQVAQPPALEVKGLRPFGARYPDASEGASRPGMNTEERKGVAMTALQQGFQRAWRRLHKRPQMSLAYSRMVRSEENQPTFATLCTAARVHAALSVQRWSMLRCAAL